MTMNKTYFFIDRRKNEERRLDRESYRQMPMDLYHRKRRQSTERRDTTRSLEQDYYAFIGEPDPELRH
jgi:hypothetical protein